MQEVLKKIKPNQKERKQFDEIVSTFLGKLNSNLNDAKATLGGSGAKDTWLSGNHDIDFYVQFDYTKFKDKSAEISNLLKETLKKSFPKSKIDKLHGSRDYFQINYKNISFEIVPIIKINKAEDALNITDISPLHAIWVNKRTKELKDDIRLAKQFCKANKLYGAESHLSGFSGYVLEILIAYYGSFEKLLKASQKWKDKEVVDPEKHYKKNMVSFNLNRSKLRSPLIVIDPVDKSRNAAAALSLEKFILFKETAKKYLKSPNKTLFEKEEVDFKKLKSEGHLIRLEIVPLIGKRDVIGMKLLKAFTLLKRELKSFFLINFGWEWEEGNKAVFYFVLKENKLPDYEIRRGPPLKLKEAVTNFKSKYKNTFVEDGFVKTKVKVEFPLLKDFVNSLLKDKYFKEKLKSVKYL
jgi:tRNA nucleotidyltransferase (CCA-adding enzyme)